MSGAADLRATCHAACESCSGAMKGYHPPWSSTTTRCRWPGHAAIDALYAEAWRAGATAARSNAAQRVKDVSETVFWSADAAAYFSKVPEYAAKSELSKAMARLAEEIRALPLPEPPK